MRVSASPDESIRHRDIFFSGNLVVHSHAPEFPMVVVRDEDFTHFIGFSLHRTKGELVSITKTNVVQYRGKITIEV